MSTLLWLALLPLYDDPDGPMYPPVTIDDRFLFNVTDRAASMAVGNVAYRLWQYYDMDEWTAQLWHVPLPEATAVRDYYHKLYQVYYDLDLVCFYSQSESGLEYPWAVERMETVLRKLRRNLGPIHYYRGEVPLLLSMPFNEPEP